MLVAGLLASPSASAATATPGPTAGHGTFDPVVNIDPSWGPQGIDQATYDAALNGLAQAGITDAASLEAALAKAGLPTIAFDAEHATPALRPVTGHSGGAHTDGAACHDWTCGVVFSPSMSFEIVWLVWAGVLIGPGLACGLIPGIGAAACGAIWALVSAYAYGPAPKYNPHRCLYVGWGFGTKALWVRC